MSKGDEETIHEREIQRPKTHKKTFTVINKSILRIFSSNLIEKEPPPAPQKRVFSVGKDREITLLLGNGIFYYNGFEWLFGCTNEKP